MKKLLFFFATTALISCKNNEDPSASKNPSEETTTQVKEEETDWTFLFNGKNAEGWRGYNEEAGSGLPQGWVVEGETLKSLGKGGDIGGDIIYEKDKYEDFELSLEWKLSPEGNSGVFYHVVESDDFDAPYYTGPEYQIIDNENFPEKLEPWQKIGADYGMYVPDYEKLNLKNVTDWNTTMIRVTDKKVTYWLNGEKTVEFDPTSEDWQQKKNGGKWKDFPEYGKSKTGYIGLQDHGSEIWFKNIKIKKL